MATKLTETEIAAALPALDGWDLCDGKLCRSFRFEDFTAAFGFMTRCALLAERMGHHPEWSNVYDRVEIALVTHDCGGVSDLDIEMARAIDGMAG